MPTMENNDSLKENPMKTVEELVEGNANMIDGIINNEPPKNEQNIQNEENNTVTTGNTSYKDIQDKQYINMETDKQQQIIGELNKQNIPFSARYDSEKITITFSKSNFEKVNDVLNSLDSQNREQQPEQAEPEQQISFNEVAEQIRKQAILDILRMQEDPDFRKKFLEENQIDFFQQEVSESTVQSTEQSESQEEQPKEEKSVTAVPENAINTQQIDTSRDSYKLLPIISTKVENQQQRIDTLTVKRSVAEEKIAAHQARINHLTEKAERLTTTNQMLQELVNNKMTPAFVKSAAQKAIKVNEDKIAKIRNVKIPKREGKIEKQQNKVAKYDRKINLAQCKINRYTSLSNVITSFSLINNSDRRKQFAAAMDNLHNSSINLYNAKIDTATAKIVDLTAKYKKSNNIMFKSAAMESITRQKISRQKNINKRNKLMGVIIPMTSQPENVQDEALKQTENVVNNELQKDNVTAVEVADNIAAAPLPALPEHSIAEPEPTQDFKRLLPEVAEVMDVSVNELESKPKDIQNMLVLDYTNHFESTPEELKESLSAIFTPNVRVEESIEQKKAEKAEEMKPVDNTSQKNESDKQQRNEDEKKSNDKHNSKSETKHEVKHTEEKPKRRFSIGRSKMSDNAKKVSEHKDNRNEKEKESRSQQTL